MGAKSKSKSKKGPKGKKARAKAKLEQVWGEHFNEDERKASRLRAGKSRLLLDDKKGSRHSAHNIKEFDPLSNARRGIKSTFETFLERKNKHTDVGGGGKMMNRNKRCHFQEEKKRDDHASSDEESSGEDDSIHDTADETMGVDGGGFTSLLRRISGSQPIHNTMQLDHEDGDGDAESSDEGDMENIDENESDIQHFDDETSECLFTENDDARQEDEMKPATADPYEAHFSKSTLEQSPPGHSNATQCCLSPSLPFLKPSLEMQMSGRLLKTWEDILSNIADSSSWRKTKSDENTQNVIQTKRAWEEFAVGPYQFVRQVLTSNWKNVNKAALKRRADRGNKWNVFSTMQMAMNPAVSRYADVLITSESRQVRRPSLDALSQKFSMAHTLLTSCHSQ